MRALTYKLADGTSVKTYIEAVESGQRFTEVLTEIRSANRPATPKRQYLLDTYGFVKPARAVGF